MITESSGTTLAREMNKDAVSGLRIQYHDTMSSQLSSPHSSHIMANPTIDVANFAAYTPAETAELICRDGVKKGHLRPDKVFLSAVSAGCILSFGCAVSLTALTAPWYQENAPGLIKLVGAWVFPLGLVIIVLTGADLFTSTNMVGSLH